MIFAGLILFCPLISMTQSDDFKVQLKERLEGKQRFSEITATIDDYLASIPDSYEKERYEKHYARWAWYQSMHLGPNGEFVNIAKRTLEAVKNKPIPEETDNRSANGSWTFIGPNSTSLNNPDADILGNGRADRIAFHPTNEDIFYVGTPSGGLWKTTTGGTTWECITSFIPSLGISGIVVDQSHPDTIYVLTGDGDTYHPLSLVNLAGYHRLSAGVLVTYDGGINWEQTGELFSGDYLGYRLVQHPTDPDILLAATSEGIYRTTNGGDTWTLEHSGRTFDIEFKPGTPARVYASQEGAFVFSINTGASWYTSAIFSDTLCSDGRVEIAVTPDAPSRVYLVAGPAYVYGANSFCGFFLSTNSGSSFTRLCTSPNVFGNENGGGSDQSDYDMAIAVSPTDYDTIVVGGLCTYRSTNSGFTFTSATTFREGGGNYIHPDIHGIEFNPLNSYVYALGDGGIHKSTNNGATYTDLYEGLNTAQFYGMDDYDDNVNTMIAGCQDNGVKYKTASGGNFDHIFCCDGGDAIINYDDPTSGYAVVNSWIFYFTHFNSDTTIEVAQPGFFPEIELHATDPTLMLYSSGISLKKYDSDLEYSTTIGGGIRSCWAVKTCPSNSNRIYTAGGDTFYDTIGTMKVTSNGGSNWFTISGTTGFPATYPRISDIGVKPTNSPEVWVTFSGYYDGVKVFYSNVTGANWTNKSFDLPNIPIWTIEVDAGNNVYVGTEYGVFYLAYNATNWEPFYNYLPNVPVSELAINESGDQLLAATFGRGIWKTSLRDPCPPGIITFGDMEGQFLRTASDYITVEEGEVIGGEGTDVYLRAGNTVTLRPGFRVNAEPGNRFKAYLGPCEMGIPTDLAHVTNRYPEELSEYNITFSRAKGTVEAPPQNTKDKKATVRIFREGQVRVLLADFHGKYIRDIANFDAKKGTFEFPIETARLKAGRYYLYLVVDDEVAHLHEMDLDFQE